MQYQELSDLVKKAQGKRTAKKYAEEAGVDSSTLYRTLKGIHRPGIDVLQKLERKICVNRKRIVKFCVLDDSSKLNDIEIGLRPKKIRFGNIDKVAKLYEEIDEFENTTVENIKNGLRTGRGYCIEVNKKVVAMAKSTLETRTHAMIVGVGTHPNFRNKGLATKCIVKICSEIINENKIPCLFYDNIEAGKIYNKLGFKEKGYWGIYYR